MIIGGLIAVVLAVVPVSLAVVSSRSRYEAKKRVFLTKQNLERIGKPVPNYRDSYADTRPLFKFGYDKQQHSWMTGLLPFIECSRIYEMRDLNKRWDSQENEAGFRYDIPFYVNYNVEPQPWKVGKPGAAHFAGNSQVIQATTGRSFPEMPKGSSNLIFAGEVSSGFKAWGDPSNTRNSADGLGNGPYQFGSVIGKKEGAMLLMADGSVKFISYNTETATLEAMSSPHE